MAKNESRRLAPSVLAENQTSFNALKDIPDYAPSNSAYSVAAITQAFADMAAAQAHEDQIQAALNTARDMAVKKEWDAHKLIRGAKNQVRAQYGTDSMEVQALGLKRESEYKSRRNKKGTPGQGS